TYNVGGNNQPSNLTIVETICDLLDEVKPRAESHRKLIRFVVDRPGHDRRYAMNISKIQRELGWDPRHNLTDGLLETVQWILDNPGWVETIQKQREYQAWLTKNYEKRETSS
ncbi:partial dTDP-glucose 4,6-dehydratase, partial [Anaerolineae bacterium]